MTLTQLLLLEAALWGPGAVIPGLGGGGWCQAALPVTGLSVPLSSLPVFEREYGGRDEACPVALQLTLLVALVQGAGGGCL